MLHSFARTSVRLLLVAVLSSALLTGLYPTSVAVAEQLGPDIAVAIQDAPDPVSAGSIVTYLVTVDNIGSDTATEVKISYWVDGDATFPANAATPSQGYCDPVEVVKECHLGQVASGATATVEVKVMALNPGAIGFGADSQAEPGDSDSNNDYAEETTTVEAAPPADVAVTVEDSPDPVAVGQTVTYLVTVENAGPGTATEVKVSYSVAGDATIDVDSATASVGFCDAAAPVSECHLDDLASGDTATVEVQVTALTLGTIGFEADGYTTAEDSQSGNDYDAEETAVVDDLCPTCTALGNLLPTGDAKADKSIEKAIDHIEKSLTAEGGKVFNEEKAAVKELLAAQSKVDEEDQATVQGAISQLVESANARAQGAIDAVDCGGNDKCETGLQKAGDEMAKAETELSKGKPDKAMDHFKKAWEQAQKAAEASLPAVTAAAGQQTIFLPLISR